MSSDHSIVVPFLNEDPTYAHGVEFGMLYTKMQNPDVDRIEDFFRTENQEQITLLANRTGWTVESMKPWKDGWILIALVRR